MWLLLCLWRSLDSDHWSLVGDHHHQSSWCTVNVNRIAIHNAKLSNQKVKKPTSWATINGNLKISQFLILLTIFNFIFDKFTLNLQLLILTHCFAFCLTWTGTTKILTIKALDRELDYVPGWFRSIINKLAHFSYSFRRFNIRNVVALMSCLLIKNLYRRNRNTDQPKLNCASIRSDARKSAVWINKTSE